MDWRVVPIERWPTQLSEERQNHRFRKTVRRTRSYDNSNYTATVSEVDWMGTLRLLERELEHLDAENVVLQMAVTQRDIRQDGWIRANARPEHPGVILSFESRFGPLSYPCDTYTEWQANVRAIAVSLEWLRGVDRHGVSKRGEQYRGWGALPPAGGTTATMTARTAAEILVDVEELGGEAELLLRDPAAVKLTYREAAKKAHPDKHGGDTQRFQLLQQARAVLERHHGALR